MEIETANQMSKTKTQAKGEKMGKRQMKRMM
jgi:hypothetical protein